MEQCSTEKLLWFSFLCLPFVLHSIPFKLKMTKHCLVLHFIATGFLWGTCSKFEQRNHQFPRINQSIAFSNFLPTSMDSMDHEKKKKLNCMARRVGVRLNKWALLVAQETVGVSGPRRALDDSGLIHLDTKTWLRDISIDCLKLLRDRYYRFRTVLGCGDCV